MVDPTLRALQDEGYVLLREGCRTVARSLGVPEPAVEQEADRLHALVDGLAVHAATHPEVTTPARMREVIAVHLTGLGRRTETT
jgi:hypothetical protein